MKLSLSWFGGLAALSLSAPALAQTLDYGGLEDLYGEPITVSATGKPQKVSEVPVNMEIITQDEIRRSGADNIPDVLQFVTGLNFRRSSFNDGEVAIRGYDQPWNPRLLVLVNGRPVYEDFYGDVVWAAIPIQLDEIRQIEVVKGPNQALFGFNAASGVVNIITYDPLLDDTDAVTLRSGTQGLAEGSAVGTAHIGKDAAVRLSVGGMQANEFTAGNLPAYNSTGLLHPNAYVANVDARWRVAPDVTVLLEGGSAQMRRNFPADATPEHDRSDDLRGQVAADTAIGLLTLDGYWSWWNIDYTGGQPEEASNTVYDVKASDLFKLGARNSVRINLEYKDDWSKGLFLNDSTIRSATYSLGAMWDWQIRDGLSFTNSIRLDYLKLGFHGILLPATGQTKSDFDRSLTATSFNSGLVYALTDQDVTRVMASRGYQLPSLNDFGQQIPNAYGVPGLTAIGDPAMRPTSVLNVEADYDHTIPSIHTTVRAALFRQWNTSLFGYDIGAPSPTLVQSVNIGGSDETGFELALKGNSPGGFRWSLSYAFATLKDHIYPSIGAGVYSAYDQSTPKHTIDFGLGYTLGRWEFDTQGRWQSRWLDYQFGSNGIYNPAPITANVVANARIGYKPMDFLTVSTTVEQFNQAQLYERASVPVERRVIVAVTAKY